MQFVMSHQFLKKTETFTEETAPAWLTSENTVVGSTMDMRWFWKDYVLKLQIGRSVQTDFWMIKRVL